MPPPLLPKAIFFIFASIKATPPRLPITFAASFKMYYVQAHLRWEGATGHDPWTNRISAYLASYPLQPSYYLRVTYAPPGLYGYIIDWRTQHFPIDRPYVGDQLTHPLLNGSDVASAIVREIPS